MALSKILLYVAVFFFITGIVICAFNADNVSTKIVPCYDEQGSVILGLSCTREVKGSSFIMGMVLSVVGAVLGILAGFLYTLLEADGGF